MNVMVLLVGDLMFDTNVSIGGVIIGTIVSALVACVIQFLCLMWIIAEQKRYSLRMMSIIIM